MKKILLLACLLFGLSPLQSFALDQFNTEQAAQKHCPADIIVWVNPLWDISLQESAVVWSH